MSEYVKTVCRIGQGENCCRYLVVGANGFECVKLWPQFKEKIDARVNNPNGSTMNAQADNCAGKLPNVPI